MTHVLMAARMIHKRSASLNVGDGNLDLDTGLDGDGGDLLHHFRRAVQINHALVHTQLEPVPGVGT